MNTLDIILLLCFIPGVVSGFSKGFILQVASIAAIVAGAWASYRFAGMAASGIAPYLGDASPSIIQICAFAITFLAVAVLVALAARALRGIVRFVMLGWLDKLLGVAFGILKIALLLSIAVILFDNINVHTAWASDETLSSSIVYPSLKTFGYAVFPYFKSLLAGL